ncbi:MAG TPA: response regulator [Thermomicrobiales bacterium]|jgi:DNA-binding response OmpR family regulator|nr:response regulator [Thermomicrobiales bacterium]
MPRDTSAPPQRHILAIDISPEVLALLADFLTDEGYRVTTRVWADHVMPAIADLGPDLIILDYPWATEDEGWSLLRVLREAPETSAIPIILCTGALSHVEETRGHLHDMGIDVIYKPFDLDELLATIRHRLHGARAGEDRIHDARPSTGSDAARAANGASGRPDRESRDSAAR